MEKVVPAILAAQNSDVVAIASRSADRAENAARVLGIEDSYGSYEELLSARNVDAVYNPLPNDLHAEWTIKAAAAGKHVLCEKPLALNTEQAVAMAQACANARVNLAEAFMYRHHPSWTECVKLVRTGAIGELQAVHSWFSYYYDEPGDIRNQSEHGGGAVMDVGCYCINLSRMLFGSEPVDVASLVRRDHALGIDTLASAILGFQGGGQATFTCGIRAEQHEGVHIIGTRGRIEIEIPFSVPPDHRARIFVSCGQDGPLAPVTEIISFPAVNSYTLQATAFSKAILDGTDFAFPISDSVANMRVIEAVLDP